MNKNKKSLIFSVEGEFITSLAREKLYIEGDANKAVKLLLSCLRTEQISEERRYEIALSILDGRAEITGTYPGEDYKVIHLEEPDPRYSIPNHISKIAEETKRMKEREEYLLSHFLEALRCLSDYERCRIIGEMSGENGDGCLDFMFECIRRELGDGISFHEARINPMLESFVQRMRTDTEDDYGWLEPNGKFHPVEWGEHQKWASEYLAESSKSDSDDMKSHIQNAGDCLTGKGWVLLHNPAQGVAVATKNPIRKLTKAQKEFLYDYYMTRNCKKEAMEVWKT